jgi:hypothetical protein
VSPVIIAAGTKTRNNKPSVLHVMIAGPPATHRAD